jgi:hypothetical protein
LFILGNEPEEYEESESFTFQLHAASGGRYEYSDLTIWGNAADCGQHCIATSPLFFCVVWTEHTILGLVNLKSLTTHLSVIIRGDSFVFRLDMRQALAANAVSVLSYTSHDSD